MTIEHKYGEATIPSAPQRVVSIGFADQDSILALGVQPIAVRDWYGDQPFATWPWAQDEFGDAEPTVLASTELNFEQIAALEPDLIIGVSSGMTDTEYATLSQIAPTARPARRLHRLRHSMEVATQLIGDSLGKSDEATALVTTIKAQFADARAAHPEFDGATAR